MFYSLNTRRVWTLSLIVLLFLAGSVQALPSTFEVKGTESKSSQTTGYLPFVASRYMKPLSVIVNEVLYYEDTGPEWVELYNPTGASISLQGWHLTNGDKTLNIALPAWNLPSGAYLVVYLGQGQSDADFSDGAGAYYTGTTGPGLNNEEDAVALYRGSAKAKNLVDFVAWSVRAEHGGGKAMADAVSAHQWSDGDFYAALNLRPIYLTKPVEPGESIGRNQWSADTNTSADWDNLGGMDSLGPTPGRRNWGLLEPVNSVDSLSRLSAPEAISKKTKKKWTIMVFMDGRDRNIRNEQVRDINLMEKVGSTANINIVVQYMDAKGRTWRCFVRKDADQAHIRSRCARVTSGVVNPGDPRALTGFMSWAAQHYPASRYALVLDGHGAGWKGLFPSGNDPLTMSELENALVSAPQSLSNILFVACLMGQLEVADQLYALTDTIVASEEVTYAVFPHDVFLAELDANPGWSDNRYATRAAQLYAQRLSQITNQYTMAAYNVWQEDTIARDVDRMAVRLRLDVNNYRQHEKVDDNLQLVIKHQARERVQEFQDRNYIDLRHFAQLISGLPLSAAHEAQQLAQDLAPGPRRFILFERHGSGVPNANGVSIYFPRSLNGYDHIENIRDTGWDDYVFDDPWPSPHLYQRDASIRLPRLRNAPHALLDDPDFSFPAHYEWDEFLHRYYKPVADACIRVDPSRCVDRAILWIGQPVTLSGVGSSDSDGPEGDQGVIRVGQVPERAVGERVTNDVPAHQQGHPHWYWDFNAAKDTGGDIPHYREGVLYDRCTDDDCDRNEKDDTDDDLDAVGREVTYVCDRVGTDVIVLWVWDEHHDQPRRHEEDKRHNQGRHWLHFNVDNDAVSIGCYNPLQPVKIADRAVVHPQEKIRYLVNLPANPEATEPGSGSMSELLPPELKVLTLTCSFGDCSVGEYRNQQYIIWEFGNRPPEQRIWMEYETQFVPINPEDPNLPPQCPTELVNTIDGSDGWRPIELTARVAVECP